ncbi:hypothetical protein J0383_19850 [Flavobacterium endoglycinae]|uniref:TerB family tellurite resistance protein n=1 Tax=Flavobacterium endoglycinae TaxID=2816357 RepID=A0ABX7QD07_9FLAO|nr:hypothetical protein [Flavobacterium endoglycinae]QSW88486.1 hypothetical protein J0383_19850 [Flavobacterium endoglycinae]
MKKIAVILITLCVFNHSMNGQAKQRKELILQIAALQVYIDYAKKGYSAVSKGLNFIGDARKGELNLHSDYFTSLLKINPKVRNYYKTAEIISMQFKIMKLCQKTVADLKTADLFHGSELDYINRSFGRLLQNCSQTLDQLLAITTDAELELKDDQRLERINELHKTMQEDYNFCLFFSSEARLLSVSKTADKKDSKGLNELYGL